MKIGIDVSQIVFSHTGVSNYLTEFVKHLVAIDQKNEYILFFSSLRRKMNITTLGLEGRKNVSLKTFRIPPTVLDILWNRLHIFPIEWFVGDIDIFITSDWTEPPAMRARKLTILYDLIVYIYPQETGAKIVATQKRKLAWAQKESALLLCISESTKKDAEEILGIQKERLRVVYPGVSII